MTSTATASPFRNGFLKRVVVAMNSTATSQKTTMATMLNTGASTITRGMRSSSPAADPTRKITNAFLTTDASYMQRHEAAANDQTRLRSTPSLPVGARRSIAHGRGGALLAGGRRGAAAADGVVRVDTDERRPAAAIMPPWLQKRRMSGSSPTRRAPPPEP